MASIKLTFEDVELHNVMLYAVVLDGDASKTTYYITFEGEGRSYVFLEKDLRRLASLLEEVLQHVNKRDW